MPRTIVKIEGRELEEAPATRRKPAPPRTFRWNARSMEPLLPIDDKEALCAILDGLATPATNR